MSKQVEQAKIGILCLVQEQEDGTIKQIGLSKDQSDMLQVFCAGMSRQKKLTMLPDEYNLKIV